MKEVRVPVEVLESLHESHPLSIYKVEEDNWIVAGKRLPVDNGVIQFSSEKSTHRLLYAFGEYKFLHHWSQDPRCVVSKSTLIQRISRGEDAESAISRPPSSGDPKPFLVSKRTGWDRLTAFQRKCLSLVAQGMTGPQAAAELSRGRTNTVSSVRVNKAMYGARKRMGYRSVAELIEMWKIKENDENQ